MNGVPIVVALIVNNAPPPPGPHTNGTLCVIRNTRQLWYWNGAWNRVQL